MDDAKQLIVEGTGLLKTGDFEGAIAKLKAAVAADPNSAQAHSYLGAAYAQNKQNPEAVEQFQAALDLQPNSAVHTFNLGQAFENAGSKPRAQTLYEKALQLDPKYARAQQRLEAITGQSYAPPRQTSRPAAPSAPTAPASAPSARPAVTQIGQPPAGPVGGTQPLGGGTQPLGGTRPTSGTQPLGGGAPPPGPGGPNYGPPSAQRPMDPSLGLGRPVAQCSPSWKRFVAALIDGLALLAIGAAVSAAFAAGAATTVPGAAPGAMPGAIPGAAPGTNPAAMPSAGVLSAIMAASRANGIVLFIDFLYFVVFNAALGATPGKLALGMRIVKTDGTKIGAGTAIGRYLLQYILSAVTCGLMYISILTNSEKRGWHDQIMDTMVVDK